MTDQELEDARREGAMWAWRRCSRVVCDHLGPTLTAETRPLFAALLDLSDELSGSSMARLLSSEELQP